MFFRYLGHLYVAESLVCQGRITEAIHHLTPEAVTDVSLTVQASEGGDLLSSCIHVCMHLLIVALFLDKATAATSEEPPGGAVEAEIPSCLPLCS